MKYVFLSPEGTALHSELQLVEVGQQALSVVRLHRKWIEGRWSGLSSPYLDVVESVGEYLQEGVEGSPGLLDKDLR